MEGFERKQGKTPFKDSLTESSVSPKHWGTGKLLEFEHEPSKIVRIETFKELSSRYKNILDPERPKESLIELVGAGQALYRELGTHYGIVAPVDFVIGKDPQDQDAVISLVDKVEGATLCDVEPSLEVALQVDELYGRIARYFLDKRERNEPHLVDLNNPQQYVYGKKEGDESDHIYLIDTDLYIYNSQAAIYLAMPWLVRHMRPLEKRFDRQFTQARETVQKVIDTPLPDTLTDKERAAVEQALVNTCEYLAGVKNPLIEDAPPF